MLERLHYGCSDISEQLGNYFLLEKMAFWLMSDICFHDAQVSWNNIFSFTSQGFSLTKATF